MTQIEDGTGSGNKAKVTSEKKISVDAVQREVDEYAAMEKEEFFIAQSPLLTSTVTEGLMFWLKNNSTTKRIFIRSYRQYSDGGSTNRH